MARICPTRVLARIKKYDLRKAQYLSGHRYISSIEKFIVKDIRGLTKEINKYFPV